MDRIVESKPEFWSSVLEPPFNDDEIHAISFHWPCTNSLFITYRIAPKDASTWIFVCGGRNMRKHG